MRTGFGTGGVGEKLSRVGAPPHDLAYPSSWHSQPFAYCWSTSTKPDTHEVTWHVPAGGPHMVADTLLVAGQSAAVQQMLFARHAEPHTLLPLGHWHTPPGALQIWPLMAVHSDELQQVP